jgi:O-antigen/teichoic acid export membrane protein
MTHRERTEFRQGVRWNIASLAITGTCGLLLNFLIARLYGASALGVFNQVFATYIIFSQLAVGGVHFSTLKHMAEHAGDREARSGILLGALIPVAMASIFFSAVAYFSAPSIGIALESPAVAIGIRWAAIGLMLFALNKVLLAAINGMEWMRALAILQALRPVTMIIVLFGLYRNGATTEQLPVVFSVAEAVVFLGAIGVACRWLWRPRHVARWIRQHVSFGLRSFIAGVLLEVNTRVDVVVLGLFSDDRTVGLYSFASILAEGVFQILMVLRNSYNPRLAQAFKSQQLDGLREMVRTGWRRTYLAMFGVGIVAIAGFPIVANLASGESDYMTAWPLFAILITGIVVASGYLPFIFVFLQAGRPGRHTIMAIAVVAFNVLANFVLIPILGVQGAAIATSLSFAFQAMALSLLTRWTFGPIF